MLDTRGFLAAAAFVAVAHGFAGLPALQPTLRPAQWPSSSLCRMCTTPSEEGRNSERRQALRILIGGATAAFAGAAVVAPRLEDLSADVPRHMWERCVLCLLDSSFQISLHARVLVINIHC